MKELVLRMEGINERIPPSLDLNFHICGTTYPNRTYFIRRPLSNVFCLEYIVSGSGHVRVNDAEFTPVAGDTYFLPQGRDHFYCSDRHTPWEKIWVNLSGSFAARLAKECGLLETYHYPSVDTSDILMKLQHYATHEDESDCAEKCTALIVELFMRLSRSLHGTEKNEKTPVEKMLSYIKKHETDVITLEKLAAICKKSPSQAERLFRREVGIPPYRYALNRKLELACRLLRETGMSVRDISAYLSFEDEFYFSGLFRRKIGVSPTEYRKNIGNATPSTEDRSEKP